MKKKEYRIDEIMETILAREIRNVMNDEIINSIKENRKPNLKPMIFNSIEDKEQYKKNFDKIINRDI